MDDENARLARLALGLQQVVPDMDPRWTKWFLQKGLPEDLTAVDAFEGDPLAEVPRLRFYFYPTDDVWNCAHITWDPLVDLPRSHLADFDRRCSDADALAWALSVMSDSVYEWARIVLERDAEDNNDPSVLSETDRAAFRRLESIAIRLEKLALDRGYPAE